METLNSSSRHMKGGQEPWKLFEHWRAQSYFWVFGRKRKCLEPAKAGGPRSLYELITFVRRKNGIQVRGRDVYC